MKCDSKLLSRLSSIFLFSLLLILPSLASDPPKVTSGKITSDVALPLILETSSRLWYEGNSTLHPFSATATQVDVFVKVPSLEASQLAAQFEKTVNALVKGNKVKALIVTIFVQGLKSGDGGLDNNMYNALKAKDYPCITYQLLSANVKNYNANTKTYNLKTTGNLTIASQTNKIEMDVTLRQLGNGLVEIDGEKQILMRDYNLEPPTIMMVIRVFNEFQIRFKLIVGTVAASAPQKEGAK